MNCFYPYQAQINQDIRTQISVINNTPGRVSVNAQAYNDDIQNNPVSYDTQFILPGDIGTLSFSLLGKIFYLLVEGAADKKIQKIDLSETKLYKIHEKSVYDIEPYTIEQWAHNYTSNT